MGGSRNVSSENVTSSVVVPAEGRRMGQPNENGQAERSSVDWGISSVYAEKKERGKEKPKNGNSLQITAHIKMIDLPYLS